MRRPAKRFSRLRIEALEDRTLLSTMLDLTFGADGKLTVPVGLLNDAGQAVAIQPDGKMLVAGSVQSGAYNHFGVIRLNPDGALDPTFGGDGKVITHIGISDDFVVGMVLQPDGKIVVMGTSIDAGSNYDVTLVRYQSDGSLDSSFGVGGEVTTSANATPTGIALAPDDKLVVTGYVFGSADLDYFTSRYNTDGTLDGTFGGGIVKTAMGINDDYAYGVTVQPDGKIVVVGSAFIGATDSAFGIVRFNVDGTLDSSFDGDGKAFVSFSTSYDSGIAVAVQSDGKIVVAGNVLSPSFNSDFGVARLLSDGTLDSTFDGDGKASTPLSASQDYVTSVAIQPDGKIVVAGIAGLPNEDMGVVRFNASGGLDNTFDGDGIKIIAIGTGSERANGLALQSDGKIVLAGNSVNSSGDDDFAVVRLKTDGSFDRLVDGTGKVTTSTFEDGTGIAVQSDGKILVAGYVFNGTNFDFAVARFNLDGTLDTTFAGVGIATAAVGAGNDIGVAVAVTPDGKIVVGGNTFNGSNDDFAAVRFNSDGSLDTTFNGTGKVITSLGSGNDRVTSVAVSSYGYVVLGGYSFNGSNDDFAVACYFSTGAANFFFNGTGTAVTPVGSGEDVGGAVAVQPDGKIVVAGTATVASTSDFAVIRYNTNGTLDSTFSGDGKATAGFAQNGAFFPHEVGSAVALQDDGKIVIAGYATNGDTGKHEFSLVRFNTNGTLDSSFSGDGMLQTNLGSNGDLARGVAIQDDGKIIAVGSSSNGTNNDFAVARYNTDGTLDNDFGQSGIFTTTFNGGEDNAFGVALAPDGKIVVTGWSGGSHDVSVLRLRNGNHDPVPSIANFSVNEDNALTVTAPYYFDPDSDSLAILLLTGPAHGTLSLSASGSFTYTPNANYFGTDSFSYLLTDSFGGKATGSVTIHVLPQNDNPTANPDFYSVLEDSSNVFDVAANDSASPDVAETLTISNFTQGLHGTVDLAGGFLRYSPYGNYFGNDTFTYTISDGNGGTASATVFVMILPVNDNPAAQDDVAVVTENSSGNVIPVLANDSCAPDAGEFLTIQGKTDGAHGTVTILGGGTGLAYTPQAGYVGSDSFTYTISDGTGGVATATVSVTVAAPGAGSATALGDVVSVPEDSPATAINVLANDLGVGVVITSVTQGLFGTVTITGGGSGLTYQPASGLNGFDSFTYTINGISTATVVVAVTPVNDAPVIGAPISATILANQVTKLPGITVNDVDAGSAQVQATLSAGPGTLTLGSIAGLTFSVGDGVADSVMTFKGTLASINNALAGLTYQQPRDSCAADSVSILVDDLGNTGSGGNQTGSANVAITPPYGTIQLLADPQLAGTKALVINGSLGNDTIKVSPKGTSTTTFLVTVNGGPVQTITGVSGRILVYGQDGDDTITISATVLKQTWLSGGAGNDIINGGGGMDWISGGAGNNTLRGGAGIDRLVEVGDTDFTLVGGTASANGSLTGVGNDVLVLNSIEAAKLSGGAGNNTFNLVGFAGATIIDGGAGSDTLMGRNVASIWNITANDGGKVGAISFAAIENLVGGSANDVFVFSNGKTVSGTIEGGVGVGVNGLNYAAYTTGVKVNLLLNIATGTAGINHIRNVVGGAANDILVGDVSGNVLNGKGGRNVVIGGAGKDTLLGGAGEDLLIAGTTDHDTNTTNLNSILTAWGAALPYLTRISNLGTLLNNATVHNDAGAVDTMTGMLGLDWFFTSAGDVVTDKNNGGTETSTVV